jgi:hypothetical protein
MSVGMRLSVSGTSLRVSSSVDHTTCLRPADFAACAMAAACTSSFSGTKCSQKNVTQNAPKQPSKAVFKEAPMSRSAWTTSAPSFASSSAFSDSTSRVSARTAKLLLLSPRMARTSPPPWLPVAPTTAMIFFSAMQF